MKHGKFGEVESYQIGLLDKIEGNWLNFWLTVIFFCLSMSQIFNNFCTKSELVFIQNSNLAGHFYLYNLPVLLWILAL